MLLKKGNCQPEMLSFLHGQVGIIFGTVLEILVHLIFLASAGLRVLLYSQVRIKQCRKHFLLLVSYGYYNNVKLVILLHLFLKTPLYKDLQISLMAKYASFGNSHPLIILPLLDDSIL